MKKFLLISLLLTLALGCACALAEDHTHSGGTATCQAKAICAVCNQPYGEVADHDWDTSAWITDGSKHWHKCKTPGCTAITDEAAHSGGTATCKEKAVCDVCKQPYGEFGEHKMEIVEPAVEPTCESPGMTAYYRCSVCEEAEIPSEEYGEPLNHDWAETLTQGDTTHYYACSRCEARKDEAPHSGGTATCQAKAKCAVCGKEYGELASHSDADGNDACDACRISMGTAPATSSTAPTPTTPSETTGVETDPVTSDDEKDGDDKSGTAPALIITVPVIALVAGGGFGAYWFVIRKRSGK